jgi:hypothetical protein
MASVVLLVILPTFEPSFLIHEWISSLVAAFEKGILNLGRDVGREGVQFRVGRNSAGVGELGLGLTGNQLSCLAV